MRGRALAAALCALVFAGCGTVRFGTPPPVERLATLRPGVSSQADVLLALGEPTGRGVTRFAAEPTPRTVWFYRMVQGEGQKITLSMLLVFLRADRYEGHLWFAGLQIMEKEE